MPKAPTREIGGAGVQATAYTLPGGSAFSWVLDPTEDTPELAFPNSAVVYDRMRKSDGQHAAVLRAATLPILRTPWHLVGDHVRPEVMAFVESELGLTHRDGRRRSRGHGVVWRDHLRLALLSVAFGFMPFEQVYEIGPPTPDQEGLGLTDVAHLRKLAPRMPRTLQGPPRVERDGGLAGIVQLAPDALGYHTVNRPTRATSGEVFIPRDRLVMYVNDREGADWTGQSLFRGSYKNWLIKDALLRLGPMVVERNGMGIPTVYYTDPSQRVLAHDMAKAVRAGSEAGAALPEGMRLEMVGVTGSTRDELPLVKYHDEAAGRSALAMFLNMGHDRGSHALGEVFRDFFVMSLDALANSIAETATEHVVRDLVELNFGPDEAYPTLEPETINSETAPTADALRSLNDSGLLGPVDPGLVQEVRRRFRLPELPSPEDLPTTPDFDPEPWAIRAAPGETPREGRPAGPGPAGIPVAAPAGAGPVRARPSVGGDPATRGMPVDPLVDRLAALNERVLALRDVSRET